MKEEIINILNQGCTVNQTANKIMELFNPTIKLTTEAKTIIKIVAKNMNVTVDAMVGKSRKREYVDARRMAMVLIKENIKDMSLSQIGKLFMRDHSTVIYAINTFYDLIEYNKNLRQIYLNLTN